MFTNYKNTSIKWSTLKEDLEKQHNTNTNPKKDLLFKMAWHLGNEHSKSIYDYISEVEYYYEYLMQLIQDDTE